MFAGPTYHVSAAWFSHVFCLFGVKHTRDFVPTSASGVLLKLNCPSSTAYTDNFRLTLDVHSGFNMSCPCSINWHHSCMGQFGSRVPIPTRQGFFHVCMACSAALTRWSSGFMSWMLAFVDCINCWIFWLHWLSMTFSFGLKPLFMNFWYTSWNASSSEVSYWSCKAITKIALLLYS